MFCNFALFRELAENNSGFRDFHFLLIFGIRDLGISNAGFRDMFVLKSGFRDPDPPFTPLNIVIFWFSKNRVLLYLSVIKFVIEMCFLDFMIG